MCIATISSNIFYSHGYNFGFFVLKFGGLGFKIYGFTVIAMHALRQRLQFERFLIYMWVIN